MPACDAAVGTHNLAGCDADLGINITEEESTPSGGHGSGSAAHAGIGGGTTITIATGGHTVDCKRALEGLAESTTNCELVGVVLGLDGTGLVRDTSVMYVDNRACATLATELLALYRDLDYTDPDDTG